MPVDEQKTPEAQLSAWANSSPRRKLWRTPNRNAWTVSVEDETGRRVHVGAASIARACELLLLLMRGKGML